MNPNEVEELFIRHGVLRRGHFALSSGRHSDVYLQCAAVLQHPRIALSLGEALAVRFRDHVDAVVSPALGGILIGNAVAYELSVRFAFAERVEGRLELRRGQEIRRGERVVVVEDVVTTGGSAAEVCALCEAAGAHVLGVGALVDRSEEAPPFRLEALLRVKARAWEPESCPLCAAGEPRERPGSRPPGR
ncbi:MAG: orotate phosphoribosyltransferase [Acidobacteria bacterium]|nr:orotate phosphoribosyltransferase [Acidobacteriota bacterium]